MHCRITRTLVS